MNKTHIYLAAAFLIILGALFIYFEPQITGKALVETRLIVTIATPNQCNISLSSGWNLVSFSCINNDLSRDEFFENFSYDDIRAYDSTDAADPWKSYKPGLPAYVIYDLTSVSRKEGYWIYLVNETEFVKNGSLAKPSFITLKHGWNLIGMPNKTTTDTYNAFEQIIPDFDYVYLYNASENDWKEWTWNSSLSSNQDLNKTTYNYGYWIYMLNDGTFTIR